MASSTFALVLIDGRVPVKLKLELLELATPRRESRACTQRRAAETAAA
jgi:hypothetical protein